MFSMFYCEYNIGSSDLKVFKKKIPNISGIQVVH